MIDGMVRGIGRRRRVGAAALLVTGLGMLTGCGEPPITEAEYADAFDLPGVQDASLSCSEFLPFAHDCSGDIELTPDATEDDVRRVAGRAVPLSTEGTARSTLRFDVGGEASTIELNDQADQAVVPAAYAALRRHGLPGSVTWDPEGGLEVTATAPGGTVGQALAPTMALHRDLQPDRFESHGGALDLELTDAARSGARLAFIDAVRGRLPLRAATATDTSLQLVLPASTPASEVDRVEQQVEAMPGADRFETIDATTNPEDSAQEDITGNGPTVEAERVADVVRTHPAYEKVQIEGDRVEVTAADLDGAEALAGDLRQRAPQAWAKVRMTYAVVDPSLVDEQGTPPSEYSLAAPAGEAAPFALARELGRHGLWRSVQVYPDDEHAQYVQLDSRPGTDAHRVGVSLGRVYGLRAGPVQMTWFDDSVHKLLYTDDGFDEGWAEGEDDETMSAVQAGLTEGQALGPIG